MSDATRDAAGGVDKVVADIDLLPLDNREKPLAVRCVKLVLADVKAFEGAADWLALEHSEKAVCARKASEWQRRLEHELHELQDAVRPCDVALRLGRATVVTDTAWRSRPGGKPFLDRLRAKEMEDKAKALSPTVFAAIRRERRARIKELKQELKTGPKADRLGRLQGALAQLGNAEFPAGEGRLVFARKVLFVAALCVWANGFAGMGELAEWRWDGRASLLDDPCMRSVFDIRDTPRHGDAEEGREQVLFPALKQQPLHNGGVSFDPSFAERLEKAVAVLEANALEAKKAKAVAAYQRKHKDLLAEARDYILAHADEFAAAKQYLLDNCGPEATRKNDLAAWDKDDRFCADAGAPRRPSPMPVRLMDGRAAFLAVTTLLNNPAEPGQSLSRRQAIVLLAVMLWAPGADKLNPVFDAFGPWERQGDPVNARWLGDFALHGKPELLNEWMVAVEAAWGWIKQQPVPALPVAVAAIPQAPTTGKQTAPVTNTARRPREGKRGRTPVSVGEARRRRNIIDKYRRRKGTCQKDFCEHEKIDQDYLKICLVWARMRRLRGANNYASTAD